MCVVLPPDSLEELCKSGNGLKYMLVLFSEKKKKTILYEIIGFGSENGSGATLG